MTLGRVETTYAAPVGGVETGGADTIMTGSGTDIVLGGAAGDTIVTDRGAGVDATDLVLGDFGFIDWVALDGDPSDIDQIVSTDTGLGGDDTICTAMPIWTGATLTGCGGVASQPDAGADVVVGGYGSDTIWAGTGHNIVLGDSGALTAYESVTQQWGTLPMSPMTLTSIDVATGGDDVITTEGGMDTVVGGAGNDSAYLGDGPDVFVGDNATLTWAVRTLGTAAPALRLVTIDTIANNVGGNDTAYGQGGEDVLVGGTLDDSLDGGTGRDLLFGDNVTLDRSATVWSASGDQGTFGIYTNPRYQKLTSAQIYSTNPTNAGTANVDGSWNADPLGNPVWGDFRITLEDHDLATQTAGLATGSTDVRFGDDHIAGGAGDDTIFGQLGNDTIQGDGNIDNGAHAYRPQNGLLDLKVGTGTGLTTDGEDYVEGGGGNDTLFGDGGRDDLIGGSSDLFSLLTPDKRPDGNDLIFGGNGAANGRNDQTMGHGTDSDTIVGDNGNILRLVGSNGQFLGFTYDGAYTTTDPVHLLPRAVTLLDYTPGGPDRHPELFPGMTQAQSADAGSANVDIWGTDEVHGEGGDDTVYLGGGNDVAFGDGGDDDIIGGWGHDWISGGIGQDGILGDDGRIFTFRNGSTEPLNGVTPATSQSQITTPGNIQVADIYVTGKLNKYVDETPFGLNPASQGFDDPLFAPAYANDVIFGGLGSDFLHGGAGEDAISGAEALPVSYAPTYANVGGVLTTTGVVETDWNHPFNDGTLLGFDPASGEFVLYDEYDPRRKIMLNTDGSLIKGTGGVEWFLNNDATEGPQIVAGTATTPRVGNDGEDVLFGDHGNDWLVGGTGRDTLWGGWGNDLLQADDILTTNGNLNDVPETNYDYEDRAVGGAGLDVLIGNTGGDRLIDWVGEFNSFIVPFSPFGIATVSRQVPPRLMEFLYALSEAQGADPTIGSDGDPRNGEPFGEAGIVTQKDDAWQDQTGGPRDPQPGNVPGGRRDVLRGADFNSSSTLDGFYVDSGTWSVSGGALAVAAQSLGGDAAAVFYVDDYLPIYYEISASVKTQKPTAGWKANAYIIFDYFSPTDFKFTGIDISTNKLVMGQRDASGWHVLAQGNKQMKGNTYYNLLVTVNGTTATLLVDNKSVFTYTYAPRYIDGVAYGLNKGMVGMGSDNARGSYDNVRVQVLPPQVTYDGTTDFTTGSTDQLDTPTSGTWSPGSTGYIGDGAGTPALAPARLGDVSRLASTSWVEITAKVATDGLAGVAFDSYGAGDFKFAALDVPSQRVVLGHVNPRTGWVVDASVAKALTAGTAYSMMVTLKGASVSVMLDGFFMVSYGYNAGVGDGRFGLMTRDQGTFRSLRVRTDDEGLVDVSPPTTTTTTAPAVVPTVSVSDASITEGNSGTTSVAVTVALSEAATATVSVPWSTVAGSALAGSDFAAASGTLVFAPGMTQQVIVLSVLGDTAVESDETFQVLLGDVSGATVTDGTGAVTIANDDTATAPPPPAPSSTPTVSIQDSSVKEGKNGRSNVAMRLALSSASTSTVTVTVRLGTGGTATAGSDFSFSTTTVSFAPGSTSATVTVQVFGDRTKEPDETVVLDLVSPTGATLGTAEGTLTILDDDSRLVVAAVGPGSITPVSDAEIATALAAATAYWRARGFDVAPLDRVQVVLTDMGGTDLGQAVGDTILLDRDAAGWGWSRADLVAVLTHELGHVLGLSHTVRGVMAPVLDLATAPAPQGVDHLGGVVDARTAAAVPAAGVATAPAVPAVENVALLRPRALAVTVALAVMATRTAVAVPAGLPALAPAAPPAAGSPLPEPGLPWWSLVLLLALATLVSAHRRSRRLPILAR